jgi:hypothetical protein
MMIFARCLMALLVRRNRAAIATNDFPCLTSAMSSGRPGSQGRAVEWACRYPWRLALS